MVQFSKGFEKRQTLGIMDILQYLHRKVLEHILLAGILIIKEREEILLLLRRTSCKLAS